MGGGSEKGARTPYEAPNTLNSAQTLRIIDVICEGEVAGFGHGDAEPFKSIFLNDTPVQNADGSFNFKGIEAHFRRGTADQSYVPGFDFTERTVPVSAQVKHGAPIVRTVSDGLIDRLRVTVGVERNALVKEDGDTLAAVTVLRVELNGADNIPRVKSVRFDEKGSGAYYEDVLFDNLPPAPFTVRVVRETPDAENDRVSNRTFFASYVEIIDAKLSYPHTALCALKIDSDQFGGQNPRRNFLLRGALIKVPSNYDPVTRQYSGKVWDGTFKKAWSNNPAWVMYHFLTVPRISTLARRLNAADIDKWMFYRLGRYCDEPVPDGFGGQEPRFTCNAYLSDAREAGELLADMASVFAGLPVWDGRSLTLAADTDSDPVALYTNSNVTDGLFHYAGAGLKAVHTAVHVGYLDPNDSYRPKIEYVADDEAIKRYGLNIKRITAFGCTSRGQAARVGAWTLQTELRQQNTVSFTVGREGLKHLPYDIIRIMDNRFAGAELSGRVQTAEGRTVTLDRETPDCTGAYFSWPRADGKGLDGATVASQPAPDTLVLEKDIELAAGTPWLLSGKVKPRLFRAVGIKENSEEGTYTITALQHDAEKYAAVDDWASFEREAHTLHTVQPVLVNAGTEVADGKLRLSWDSLTAQGGALDYDIKIYRNGKLYRENTGAKTPELQLESLPDGDYRAEIRGRNARGILSEPLVKTWQIHYTLAALRTEPRLLAVDIKWKLPALIIGRLHTEIWYGRTGDFAAAEKLAELPAPQNSYTLNGVGLGERLYFWARIVGENGHSGETVGPVEGRADDNPAPLLEQIQGSVGKDILTEELKQEIEDTTAVEERLLPRFQEAAAKADAAEQAAQEAFAEAQKSAQAADALKTRYDTLESDYQGADGIKARFSTLEQALSDGTHALARKVGTLESDVNGANGGLKAKIRNLEQTRASKNEVANLARQTLSSEWQSAAEAAKNQAVQTASDDAKRKADAARQAAERAAQAKADAAKAAAIADAQAKDAELARRAAADAQSKADAAKAAAERSAQSMADTAKTQALRAAADDARQKADTAKTQALNTARIDAQRKADAAKQAAIADAAAKAAEVARNAAADAQQKADAAKAEALAETARVERHVNAEIDNIRQTRISRSDAEALIGQSMRTRFEKPDTRNDNRNPSWYWTNYPRQTAREFKRAQVIGTASSGFCSLETEVPWGNHTGGNIVQTAYGDDGTVKRRRSDVQARLEGGRYRYTRDTWTAWEAVETASGAQAKADAAKQAAERAAQTKADAAKAEALAQAAADAQRKADAAKAQAVQTASADAQNKADTAKAEAIQAAAADAQQKADAVRRAADAAHALAVQTDTVLNEFKSSYAGERQAQARRESELAAKVSQAAHGGRNLIEDSRFARGLFHFAQGRSDGRHEVADGILRIDMPSNTWRNVALSGRRSEALAALENGTYVLSYEARAVSGSPVVRGRLREQLTSGSPVEHIHAEGRPTGEWQRFYASAAVSKHERHDDWLLILAVSGTGAAEFRRPKLEYGTEPTAWLEAQADLHAGIRQLQTATAAAEGARQAAARAVQEVESRLQGAEASVRQVSQTVADLNGNIGAMHTLQVETVSNGRKVLAGVRAAADGQTGEGGVTVYADRFAVADPRSGTAQTPFVVRQENGRAKVGISGDLIADGTVLGRHIRAGEELSAPVIRGGRIQIGEKFAVDANGNYTMTAAAGGQTGLSITNDAIVIRDETGRVRVVLGKLSGGG